MGASESHPDPARVVADADVLAADLLAGGRDDDGRGARAALDVVRRHSWVELVATDELLADARAVVTSLSDASLSDDWCGRLRAGATVLDQDAGDHPALAAAYHGDAAHLLSFDERLRSASTGATLRKYVDTSVKHPGAFARLFDPERLYPVVVGGDYPGPDRDPRA